MDSFYVGIGRNDIVDSVAKASVETPYFDMLCTYSGMFSKCKKSLEDLWNVPEVHDFYSKSQPGSVLLFEGHRS